jgi:hypothetical protein
MAVSNHQRGSYYKARSKRHLEVAGYDVADMELLRNIWTPVGMLPVKKDQWASDLLGKSDRELVFVQVKSVAPGRSPDIRSARRKFADAGPWPPGTRRIVHVWRRGARNPEVVECQ